jgi:hypothetical protein
MVISLNVGSVATISRDGGRLTGRLEVVVVTNRLVRSFVHAGVMPIVELLLDYRLVGLGIGNIELRSRF